MRQETWTPEALLDHLQKAVYLELWTIPLYLTAAYSLQVPGTDAQNPPKLTPARSAKNPNHSREQVAFNHIYSIVVQEMLHLELASNLFNALFAGKGYAPKFTGEWAPRYDAFPSWIGVKLPVQLGAVNPTQMQLLAAVETPEPASDAPPNGPKTVYDSIGQFYEAIEQGIDQLWDSLYDPAADQRQKDEFGDPTYPGDDYTGFSKRIEGDSETARKAADGVIRAIIDQGEGSRGPFIPADLHPKDLGDLEDRVSHFARFRMVQAMLQHGGALRTYGEEPKDNLEDAQRALDGGYAKLLQALEQGFAASAPLNLDSMWSLPGQIVAVWAAGGVPAFRPAVPVSKASV